MPRLLLILLAALTLPDIRDTEAAGSSRVQVIDGDTLRLDGESVRLHGIDAPETGQDCTDSRGTRYDCGRRATRTLAALVHGRAVSCTGRERDRYGRLVAVCRAGGTEVNQAMVTAGWTLAFRRYSQDYVDAEAQAKQARRGLWSGRFTEPWVWRRGGAPARVDSAPGRVVSAGGSRPTKCAIKGNISDNGRIYHTPGSAHYQRTRISERRGERWFCTEAEARAAGWRPAGG